MSQTTRPPDIHATLGSLIEARERFLAYVRRRLDDPELAEDILQESLLRAVRAAPDLDDRERLLGWFTTVLKHAIVDAYRRRDVANRRTAPLPSDLDVRDEPSDDEAAALCACFEPLIGTLKPAYADLIRAVELGGERPEQAAARLHVTPNNLKVRRHRARQALRRRLEETCRTCADHGCLDCTCQPDAPPSAPPGPAPPDPAPPSARV